MPSFNGCLLFTSSGIPAFSGLAPTGVTASSDGLALIRVIDCNGVLHGIFTTAGSCSQGLVDSIEVIISSNPSNDLDRKPTDEECVFCPGFYDTDERAHFLHKRASISYRIRSVSIRKSIVGGFDGINPTKCGWNSHRTPYRHHLVLVGGRNSHHTKWLYRPISVPTPMLLPKRASRAASPSQSGLVSLLSFHFILI